MDSIRDSIINFPWLNSGPKNKLLDEIEVITVKKRTVLQKKGDPSDKAFFVKKGLIRSYTIDSKGKEHVFMFGPEGWIVSDIESQTKGAPCELYIDALEDSELEVFDKDLIEILKNNPETKIDPSFFSIETNRLLRRVGVLQKRVIMLMSASAQTRYEDFLQTYPQIVQRVPQKMIASYLGITPEALSKIRRHIAKGNGH